MQFTVKRAAPKRRPRPPPDRGGIFGIAADDDARSMDNSHEQPPKDGAVVVVSAEETELPAAALELRSAGNALGGQGRFGEALRAFDAAIAAAAPMRDARLYELRAQTLLALDRDYDAAVAAETAARLAPTWADAWLTLARARRNLGEVDGAAESFDTALRLAPGDVEVRREARECDMLCRRAMERRRRAEDRAAALAAHGDAASAEVLRCKAALRPTAVGKAVVAETSSTECPEHPEPPSGPDGWS